MTQPAQQPEGALPQQVPGQQPIPGQQPYPDQPAPPGRLAGLIIAAAILVLVLIVGLITWLLVGRGDGDVQYAGQLTYPLVEPVEREPEEVWSIDLDDGSRVQAVGSELVVVWGESGGGSSLLAYDLDDGELVWEQEFDGADLAYLRVTALAEERFLVATSKGDGGYEVATLGADGEEEWSAPGALIDLSDEAMLLRDDDEVAAVDLDSGDERWSVEVEQDDGVVPWSYGVLNEEIAALVMPGEVIGYDPDSGEELWTEDFDAADLAAAEGIVVAYSEDGAIGLDPRSGEEIYSTDASALMADRVAPDQVLLATTDSVQLLDAEGAVTSGELGPLNEVYWISGYVVGGERWFRIATDAEGDSQIGYLLLDGDLEVALEGLAVPTTDGLYVLEGDQEEADVEFRSELDAEPSWTATYSGNVWTVDDGLLINGSDDLALYR